MMYILVRSNQNLTKSTINVKKGDEKEVETVKKS